MGTVGGLGRATETTLDVTEAVQLEPVQFLTALKYSVCVSAAVVNVFPEGVPEAVVHPVVPLLDCCQVVLHPTLVLIVCVRTA
jgi:hypothetical protein